MFIVGIPYTNCKYESEIPCTSEAEAVAVACGAWLGGQDSLVFMQDVGVLAALNVIVGLADTYDINIKIYTRYRRKPKHHELTFQMIRHINEKNRSNKTNTK